MSEATETIIISSLKEHLKWARAFPVHSADNVFENNEIIAAFEIVLEYYSGKEETK